MKWRMKSVDPRTFVPWSYLELPVEDVYWTSFGLLQKGDFAQNCLLLCFFPKVSSDTLHITAAYHMFQETLKPQVLKLTREDCLSIVNKETAKTIQTIQSYLCSVANTEWAVGLAQKIAQELPPGSSWEGRGGCSVTEPHLCMWKASSSTPSCN